MFHKTFPAPSEFTSQEVELRIKEAHTISSLAPYILKTMSFHTGAPTCMCSIAGRRSKDGSGRRRRDSPVGLWRRRSTDGNTASGGRIVNSAIIAWRLSLFFTMSSVVTFFLSAILYVVGGRHHC